MMLFSIIIFHNIWYVEYYINIFLELYLIFTAYLHWIAFILFYTALQNIEWNYIMLYSFIPALRYFEMCIIRIISHAKTRVFFFP